MGFFVNGTRQRDPSSGPCHEAVIALLGFGSLILYGLSSANRGMQRGAPSEWIGRSMMFNTGWWFGTFG